MAISNSISSSNTLKFDDVVGVIMSEKIDRKSLGGSTLGSVLNAKSRGRSKERGNNHGSHGKSWGNSKGNKMSQSRGLKDYRYYGKPGHWKKDCWSQKNNEGDKLEGNKEENVVSNKFEEDVLLLSL